MFYYFYMLRCADNSLYSGITNNIERRLKEHNSGSARSAKYTRAKQPVLLVYQELYPNLKEALSREREVKKWTKAKKEQLINSAEFQKSPI